MEKHTSKYLTDFEIPRRFQKKQVYLEWQKAMHSRSPSTGSVDTAVSDHRDSASVHSDSPFQLPNQPAPSFGRPLLTMSRIDRDLQQYDAERAQASYPEMPQPQTGAHLGHGGTGSSSWDLLAGIRKFEHSYEEFDTRNASQSHLAFAEGDVPSNRVSRSVLEYRQIQRCATCYSSTAPSSLGCTTIC